MISAMRMMHSKEAQYERRLGRPTPETRENYREFVESRSY